MKLCRPGPAARWWIIVSVALFALAAPAPAQTWIELSPVGSPPSNFGEKLINYDAANNRMIAYFSGGQVWVLTNANGLGGTPAWIQLQPSGSPPFSTFGHTVVFDETTNRLIVYGGCSFFCGSPLSNVFVLSNANGLGGTPMWTQSSVTNPVARTTHSSVFDPQNNLMISFGGHLAFFGTDQNDTRILSTANGVVGPSTWTTLSPSGALPGIRSAHTAVYDRVGNRMTLFGGDNLISSCCPYTQGQYNDVWVLSNANGMTGTPIWTQLFPVGTAPVPRGSTGAGTGHTAVHDATHNRMLVFGGLQWVQAAQDGIFLGDLWELSHANGLGGTPAWTQLFPSGTPPGPRFNHGAAFDSVHQRMIVFGGREPTGVNTNRVWVLIFNQPPVADAGQDQIVECASPSGSPVTLDGSASSDPDLDTLSYEWRDADNNVVGTTASLTLSLELGEHTFALTVDDGKGGTASDSVTIQVVDTTPPTLTLSSSFVTVVVPTASATSVAVDVLAASGAVANDLCDPAPALSHNGPAVFPIGTTIVTITATDDSGNYAQKPFTVQVMYNFIGFLPPIRNDGSSIFKSGRTIPIRFQLTAADGSFITNATATLSVFRVTDAILGTTEELTPDAAGASNTSNLFRFDPTSNQYIYNLQTTGYPGGTYILRAVPNDGTAHEVMVSIRQ